MEFFSIRNPIQKVGTNQYIIGDDPTQPQLVITDGGLTADTIQITSGVQINGVDISSDLEYLPTLFQLECHHQDPRSPHHRYDRRSHIQIFGNS